MKPNAMLAGQPWARRVRSRSDGPASSRSQDHVREDSPSHARLHALQEMLDDVLTASDIRRIVLTGRVRERQKDRTTDESKYVIDGHTCDGRAGTVLGKLGRARRLVILFTVYLW